MLGIVIANWNGERILQKCLESLDNQTYKNFKIYIVDNGSKDNSIKIIKDFQKILNIHLVELRENSGFAHANNLGISTAIKEGCQYILTLNNDIEVEKNCLTNAFKVVENSKYDVFQLFMINYFDREKCDAAGLIFKESLEVIQAGFKSDIKDIEDSNVKIDGPCAGAAIYSAKALEKVKLENGDYFDSEFFAYYEDVDLALRLKRSGYLSCLLKDSITYHMHSATSSKSNGFKEYYLSRNLFLYTKRNQKEINYKRNIKYYNIIIFKALIKSILRFNYKAIRSIAKGYRDGISKASNINYKRYPSEV
jgi:GT2 family glycosyltransferase